MLSLLCSALARNCDATIDDKKGATAKDWKNGKPVRVVRLPHLQLHSVVYSVLIGGG